MIIVIRMIMIKT